MEWYKLDLDIRADLVPLIEGVRPGANIELWKLKEKRSLHFLKQKRCLEACLKKFRLVCRNQRDDYYIARDDIWLEKLFKGEIKTGEFLGYPKCCVAAFLQGCRQFTSGRRKRGPAVWYCRKMEKAYRKGELNKLLLWALHVPCGVDCKETLAMASGIKAVLEGHDGQAAHHLVTGNVDRVYQFRYYYPR